MIKVSGLTKEFAGNTGLISAVDNVSLDVPEGKFVSIVGPSGCGKTTFLRILAGLEDASEGEVRMGTPATPYSNSMVFQGDSVFPWMTVWDNAAYGLKIRGVPDGVLTERVGRYLEKTGLSKFAKAYPHELSGGMKQRVSIARAFANDPDVFLMDEPFSALDEQNRTILQHELLKVWDESRKTVVFVTHSVDEAVTLSDTVIVMTARPARIKSVIEVPFARPRDVLELRKDPEYGRVVYQIWESLRSEVTGIE